MYCFHILEINYKMSLHFVIMNTEHAEDRTIKTPICVENANYIRYTVIRIYNIPEI